MKVTIEIAPPTELLKKLETFETEMVEAFLDDWADAVLFEAQRLLREGRIEGSNDPFVGGGAFDTGKLKKFSLVVRTAEDKREVRFTQPYAEYVEFGAAPHMPPVKPLQEWARRNKMSNWKNAGWAIAMKIKKEGLPPKPFLRQASLTVEKRLNDIWNNVVARFNTF